MKKKISKLLSILLTVCFISTTPNITYAKIGDVVGHTKYTDIVAYINHFAIQSYNYNGYTYVVAEDLRNFGFCVEWNGYARTLNISRDTYNNNINQYSIPSVVPKNMVGTDAHKVLETDIRTYVNGVLSDSGNINGKTVISFEDLKQFGKVEYNDDIRAIKLWVEDGLQMNREMQKLRVIDGFGEGYSNLYQAETVAVNMILEFINDYSFATLGDVNVIEYNGKYYFDAIMCGNGYTDDAHLIISVDKSCKNPELVFIGTGLDEPLDEENEKSVDLYTFIYEYDGWTKVDVDKVL